MSIAEMDRARHAEERGQILLALQQNYRAEMTTVRTLAGALDLMGYPMTAAGLEFHLVVLADQGYVRIWRWKDVSGYRRDRQSNGRADAVMFARLLPLGLQLIDGVVEANPQIRF